MRVEDELGNNNVAFLYLSFLKKSLLLTDSNNSIIDKNIEVGAEVYLIFKQPGL